MALAAGRPVFTAGNPANIIIAGKVVSFVDWNDPTHFLTQPNAALQVPAPVVDAEFNGKPVVTSNGTQGYQSTKPASFYSYTMDGISFESFRVFAPANVGGPAMVTDGTEVSPGVGGYQAYFGGVPGKSTATLLNTTGSSVNASYGTLLNGAPIYTDIRFELAGAQQYELRTRGALDASGAYSSPPSPSGPSRDPLRLLSNSYPAITFAFVGRWAAVLHFPALTPAQRAIVHAWILQEYGIAPSLFEQVLQIAQGRPVFTAGNPANVVLAGKVVSFADWNDPTAHFMTQSNAAFQVAAPVNDPAFNNAPIVSFTGGQVYRSNRPPAAWSFAADGVSYEQVSVLAQQSGLGEVFAATTYGLGPGNQSYWGFGAGFGENLLAGGLYVVQVSGFGVSAVGVPTAILARYELAGAPQYELRQKGTLATSGAYAAAVTPGNPADVPMTIGANAFPTPALYPTSMRLGAFCCFPALSAIQRAIVYAWILETYGVPLL